MLYEKQFVPEIMFKYSTNLVVESLRKCKENIFLSETSVVDPFNANKEASNR